MRCYPQAFAAAVTMMDKLLDKPRVLIVDIGGFTADYLMMRSGRADLTICDSLENGVILLLRRQIEANDPAHDAVIRLFEKQGPRSKAQFLVNAVLHYINCPETPGITIPQTVDRAAIEEIVADILGRNPGDSYTSKKLSFMQNRF